MSENKIELKSVNELLGMKFFIPSYQRGYRWTEQQVRDMLEDIWDFSQKENKSNGDFYCLQPLVVKSKDEDVLTQIKNATTIEDVKTLLKGSWEVIDGQQRLTTIFIILFILNCEGDKQYTLSYETRNNFGEFLDKIKDIDTDKIEEVNAKFQDIVNEEKKWDNIDFYHIFIAFVTIKKMFEGQTKLQRHSA